MSEERLEEKEITCVICPNSCRLTVWRDAKTNEVMVKGYECPRGKNYGFNEYTNPVRMLITTMRIEGGTLPVIPIRSEKELPKSQIFNAIRVVNDHACYAPVKMGDIVIKNILDTGVDIIASRDMESFCDETESCEDLNKNPKIKAIHNLLLKAFYKNDDHLSKEIQDKLEHLEKEILEKIGNGN